MSAPDPSSTVPAGVPPKAPRRKPATTALLAVLIAAVGGGVLAHFAWPSNSSTSSAAKTATRNPLGGGLSGGGGSANAGGGGFGAGSGGAGGGGGSNSGGASTASGADTAVAGHIDPDLVDINTTLAGDDGEAAGTGIVVTSSGEVITNNHVIDGATQITARDIGNGKTYTATVVGYDPTEDIAVLALHDASGLSTAPLGNSSTVQVGAAVVTIGNAGGVGGTPSVAGGSVVSLNQSITAGDDVEGTSEHLTGLIGIDGSLEPGDSGGPLVSSSGSVVGIDTAASSSFSFAASADQGFAIPIDTALSIAKEIVAHDSTSSIHIGASAMLGVLIATGDAGTSGGGGGYGYGGGGYGGGGYGYGGNGGSANGSTVAGAPVDEAVPGSPAAKAGLGLGDTITALNGQKVSSAEGLMTLMERHHPGDQVTVTWTDSSGSSHTAKVTLATGPSD